jgi:hypothetical protein
MLSVLHYRDYYLIIISNVIINCFGHEFRLAILLYYYGEPRQGSEVGKMVVGTALLFYLHAVDRYDRE